MGSPEIAHANKQTNKLHRFQLLPQVHESYYNKRNAHFDVQELLLRFWAEHRETWQVCGAAREVKQLLVQASTELGTGYPFRLTQDNLKMIKDILATEKHAIQYFASEDDVQTHLGHEKEPLQQIHSSI